MCWFDLPQVPLDLLDLELDHPAGVGAAVIGRDVLRQLAEEPIVCVENDVRCLLVLEGEDLPQGLLDGQAPFPIPGRESHGGSPLVSCLSPFRIRRNNRSPGWHSNCPSASRGTRRAGANPGRRRGRPCPGRPGERHVEIAVADGPLDVFGERADGEEDRSGVRREVLLAVGHQPLRGLLGAVFEGEQYGVGEHLLAGHGPISSVIGKWGPTNRCNLLTYLRKAITNQAGRIDQGRRFSAPVPPGRGGFSGSCTGWQPPESFPKGNGGSGSALSWGAVAPCGG